MIDLISSILELNTVFILLGLVVLFVVAFKVLEMLMQTVLVTILSGAFYVALTYLIEAVTFSLDTMLFFALIGGTLYTAYSLLAKSYKIASLLLLIPLKILGIIKGIIRSLTPSKEDREK